MPRFDDRLYANTSNMIWADAQARADANGAPVMIIERDGRDGWLAICEEPPDMMEPDPIAAGWTERALIDPSEVAR